MGSRTRPGARGRVPARLHPAGSLPDQDPAAAAVVLARVLEFLATIDRQS